MWNCPSCHQPLTLTENTWQCDNGHSYDRAKEGYVNLLLAQHKRSKEPGDNKQMINARRLFLEKGFYDPLADELAKQVSLHSKRNELTVFDAGCGEGYYLQHVRDMLIAKQITVRSSGCDISKVAVQKAAKKYKSSDFCVASTYNLPLAEGSQSVVIQVFAPSSEREVHRVLKTGGLWLQADPGHEHLHQLKSTVYQTGHKHQDKVNDIPGFDYLGTTEVSFDISLENIQDRQNLLLMTPFYWSTSEAAKLQLEQELEEVSCHFQLRLFRKHEVSDCE